MARNIHSIADINLAKHRASKRMNEAMHKMLAARKSNLETTDIEKRAAFSEERKRFEYLYAYWKGFREALRLISVGEEIPDQAKTTYSDHNEVAYKSDNDAALHWYWIGMHDGYNLDTYRRKDDPAWVKKIAGQQYNDLAFEIGPPTLEGHHSKSLYFEDGFDEAGETEGRSLECY